MNGEICCITNKGKMAKNEWDDDSDFLLALYSVNKKLGQFFFHTLLANRECLNEDKSVLLQVINI